jgi:predicted metal-dependent phosphoesterase TrpH
VELAADSGIGVLALTDHDTVAGLPEAEARAAELGVRLVRGVELEIAFAPGEFHLLGLDLARVDGELAEALTGLARSRVERNERIIARINEAGIPATMEELEAIAKSELSELDGQIGRPHIATLLVRKKAVRNRQEAFDRYLAKGRPFYESKDCLELDEALRLVHEAGGLAIAAHPRSLFISWGRLATLMDSWREAGIDGIEAWHPTAKPGECRRLEKMGRERGFRVTAGSDFHGAARPERKLGRTAGRLPIGDEWLAALER